MQGWSPLAWKGTRIRCHPERSSRALCGCVVEGPATKPADPNCLHLSRASFGTYAFAQTRRASSPLSLARAGTTATEDPPAALGARLKETGIWGEIGLVEGSFGCASGLRLSHKTARASAQDDNFVAIWRRTAAPLQGKRPLGQIKFLMRNGLTARPDWLCGRAEEEFPRDPSTSPASPLPSTGPPSRSDNGHLQM